MRCVKCIVSKARYRVTLGKVEYPLCGSCSSKMAHPANKLAELFREQDRVAKAAER